MSTLDEALEQKSVAVLEAALMHVPFEGWSRKALEAGAVEANVAIDSIDTLFPNGVIDAIILHSRLADKKMVAEYGQMSMSSEKTHLRIRSLILCRLQEANANKDAVRRALTFLALPAHTKISAKLLYETIDSMWRAAGQLDTGFSFYTRRATLAGVYSSTMLAWLADDSPNMNKTISFLDRRLANVASIPKMTAPLRSISQVGERLTNTILRNIGQRHAK